MFKLKMLRNNANSLFVFRSLLVRLTASKKWPKWSLSPNQVTPTFFDGQNPKVVEKVGVTDQIGSFWLGGTLKVKILAFFRRLFYISLPGIHV